MDVFANYVKKKGEQYFLKQNLAKKLQKKLFIMKL